MSVWNNLKTWLKQLSTELFADENGVAAEVKKLAAPTEQAVAKAKAEDETEAEAEALGWFPDPIDP